MEVKQVIILRKDLGMRKGKCVAQGAHASLQVTLDNIESLEVKSWLNTGMTKIVVSVDSEQELLNIYQKAMAAKLSSCLIRDAGKTEFNGIPTFTAVAVGPASAIKIDLITGDLKLL